MDTLRTRIAALFSEGQKRGEVRRDLSANELASQFWNAWQGALPQMQIEKSGRPLHGVIDLNLGRLVRSS